MSFEDVMLKRLANCHAEACDEVLAGVQAGRSLGDAVLDVIEALPKSRTRDLRRWLEDWEPWEEWQGFAAKGWRAEKRKGDVLVTAPWSGPEKIGRAEYRELSQLRNGGKTKEMYAFEQERQIRDFLDSAMRKDGPSPEVVAAAAGVRRVEYQRMTTSALSQNEKISAVYEIVAAD